MRAVIRTQVAAPKVPTTQLDLVDILSPPGGKQSQFFSVNPSNGLVAVRSAGEVLYLAFGIKADVTEGGFFPNGLNGNIRMSAAPATAMNLYDR